MASIWYLGVVLVAAASAATTAEGVGVVVVAAGDGVDGAPPPESSQPTAGIRKRPAANSRANRVILNPWVVHLWDCGMQDGRADERSGLVRRSRPRTLILVGAHDFTKIA